MIQIPSRSIEVGEDEVVIGKRIYRRKVDALHAKAKINPADYALVQEGNSANFALSTTQQLNGLSFNQMNIKALEGGLLLARVQDFTPYLRNVNLALQRKRVLYDAFGNLIEGERLEQCGNAVNKAWGYLNNAYEKGTGFLGLDVIHITGLDAKGKPTIERQPLEECVVDCWADILGPANSQGYHTARAPVQKFELGKTVYISAPQEGCVVGFVADSVRAVLVGYGYPQVADSWLGGFLRAEGTTQNLGDSK